jgi:hypothetical protein
VQLPAAQSSGTREPQFVPSYTTMREANKTPPHNEILKPPVEGAVQRYQTSRYVGLPLQSTGPSRVALVLSIANDPRPAMT